MYARYHSSYSSCLHTQTSSFERHRTASGILRDAAAHLHPPTPLISTRAIYKPSFLSYCTSSQSSPKPRIPMNPPNPPSCDFRAHGSLTQQCQSLQTQNTRHKNPLSIPPHISPAYGIPGRIVVVRISITPHICNTRPNPSKQKSSRRQHLSFPKFWIGSASHEVCRMMDGPLSGRRGGG